MLQGRLCYTEMGEPLFRGVKASVFQDFKTSILGGGGFEKSPWVMRVVRYLRGIICLYATCLTWFAKLENLDLLVPEIGMEAFNGLLLHRGDGEK